MLFHAYACGGFSRRLQAVQGPPGASRGLQRLSAGWSGWTGHPPAGGGGVARVKGGF